MTRNTQNPEKTFVFSGGLILSKLIHFAPSNWDPLLKAARSSRLTGAAWAMHLVTVAILAQGTSWAVAVTQAFLASGSIPTRVEKAGSILLISGISINSAV